MRIRTYTELERLPSLEERFEYLKLQGEVGQETFGFDRYINQRFYRSLEWLHTRDSVIIRDHGCDLADRNYEIKGRILIHHMNPVTRQDLEEDPERVLDPDFLVCVSLTTHNAIHFSDKTLLPTLPITRSKNDTCPWL